MDNGRLPISPSILKKGKYGRRQEAHPFFCKWLSKVGALDSRHILRSRKCSRAGHFLFYWTDPKVGMQNASYPARNQRKEETDYISKNTASPKGVETVWTAPLPQCPRKNGIRSPEECSRPQFAANESENKNVLFSLSPKRGDSVSASSHISPSKTCLPDVPPLSY